MNRPGFSTLIPEQSTKSDAAAATHNRPLRSPERDTINLIRILFMMSDQMRASFLFCVISMWPFVGDAADQWFDLRRDMVREFVEAEGVTDERVLKSMRSVPRHEFCLPKFKAQAYQDTALPIGSRQTISPPFVVAYMTEVIDPPGNRSRP